MRRLLITIVVAVGAVSGCSTAAPPAAALAPAAAPARDEAQFLREVRSQVGPGTTDAAMIANGDILCNAIGQPGLTRDQLLQAATQKRPDIGAMMLDESERYLCPEKHYAPATVAGVPASPIAATPTGPAMPINAHDWQLIAKDPASHVGQSIIVYGHVDQFDTGTGTSGFLGSVDGVVHRPQYGYANYPTRTALTGDPTALANVVNGDLFTAEVAVAGPYTYPTTMGGQATVPMLTITKLTVTGHTAN
jgi:hypothetical protein